MAGDKAVLGGYLADPVTEAKKNTQVELSNPRIRVRHSEVPGL